MTDYRFFAFLNRLKFIGRWSLMRNTRIENVAEHSYQTALLAHALCIIKNTLFGTELSADKAAAIALYHESAEVLTGDLPTPVKYFNEDIQTAYKNLERLAERQILDSLPAELADAFDGYVMPDKASGEYALVKQADKLAAYIKCIEESESGNSDFREAEKSVKAELDAFGDPALNYFMKYFIGAFYQSLDESLS